MRYSRYTKFVLETDFGPFHYTYIVREREKVRSLNRVSGHQQTLQKQTYSPLTLSAKIALPHHLSIVEMVPRPPRWSAANDETLADLFRRGIASTTNLDPRLIRQVQEAHLPQVLLKNFAPLYRKKCLKYNLDQQVTGGRRTSAAEEGGRTTGKCFWLIVVLIIRSILTQLFQKILLQLRLQEEDNQPVRRN